MDARPYIKTSEGFIYLVSFIDVFSRKIEGWSLGKHMTAQFVAEAFKNAIAIENVEEGLIVHSDRGCQFSGHLFLEELKKVKATPSMSAPGTPYDNAMLESFSILKKMNLNSSFHLKNLWKLKGKYFSISKYFITEKEFILH